MRSYLLLIILIIFITKTSSQQLLFQRIHESTGLKSDHVQDIAQDNDGYIWISTYEGLVRFDGFVYQPISSDEGWPIERNTGKLFVDCNNQLWVLSSDTCAFLVKNIHSNKPIFSLFKEIRNPVKAIQNESCTTYVADKRSIFIIRENIIVQHKIILPKDTHGNISDIYYSKGAVYIATTTDGLYHLNCNTTEVSKLAKKGSLLSDSCNTLAIVNNDIWVGHNNGFSIINKSKNVTKTVLPGKDHVNNIISDTVGQTWVSTSHGLRVYKNQKLLHLFNAYNNLLTSEFFTKTFFDRENNIWLCTARGGIYFINNYFLHKYPPTFDEIQPVFGMEQQNDSIYWIGHFGLGIMGKYMINLPRLNYDTILHPSFDATHCVKDTLQSKIYFVGYFGMTEIDINGGITYYTDPTKFTNPYLISIWNNSNDNAIYIGSKNGVTKFKQGIFTKLANATKQELSINKGVATSKYHFIGTNRGIKKIVNDTIFNEPLFDKLYTANKEIKILVKDAQQNIWADIGSNRVLKIITGEYKLNFQVYNLYSLLGIAGPYNLFFYKNLLWIRNFSKIYMFNSEKLAHNNIQLINELDEHDGLVREAPYEAGMYMDDFENLWIYGNYGIFKYDYTHNIENRIETKTHIINVRPNLPNIDFSKFADSVSSNTGLPINMQLPYYIDEITFDYIGLCYRSPGEVRYKFRLLGLKNEWSIPSHEPHASYNNLSPGNYTFQVISCNNDGLWNREPSSFTFKILPAWYQTWWFKLIIAIALASVIYLIFLWRINIIKKEKNRQIKLTQDILASQEQERKRIAQDLHDGVGQELSMLKVNIEKIKNEPILFKVNKIIDDIRFLSRNIHPHYFEKLGLTRAIEMIVDENNKLGKIFWVHELENIDKYLNTNQQLMIFRVIQECINNIVKHSGAKNAKVTIAKKVDEFLILIQDNGVGFNVSTEKINSLGLSTIRERIRSLNGSIHIDSKEGKGTSTSIVIPTKG